MGLFELFNKQKPETTSSVKSEDFNPMEVFNMRSVDFPMPKEQRGQEWVLFGPNNTFPLDLLAYRNSSAIHDSIIEGKTNLIAGNGLMYDESREISDNWLIQNFKMVPFHRKIDKVFWMVTRDYLTFGYACFEVIYSMDRTRIVDINWVDASRVACGKKETPVSDIEKFYYCENWSDTRKNEPVEIEAYNPNGEDMRQLMFIRNNDNNMDYYALPNYFAALKWVKADGLMADYNVNAIQNGFSPSIVFKFYKKPTPEERRLNAEAIKAQHGGTKNAGKALIFYADGKELAPDVNTLDATNIDQRLLQVSEQIVQQIISAHRVHPSLCGIQVPSKLGYSNELLQSWSIMDMMVIRPERKQILDAFKEVLVFNGVIRVKVEELAPISVVE
jgi:capsid portal protein